MHCNAVEQRHGSMNTSSGSQANERIKPFNAAFFGAKPLRISDCSFSIDSVAEQIRRCSPTRTHIHTKLDGRASFGRRSSCRCWCRLQAHTDLRKCANIHKRRKCTRIHAHKHRLTTNASRRNPVKPNVLPAQPERYSNESKSFVPCESSKQQAFWRSTKSTEAEIC